MGRFGVLVVCLAGVAFAACSGAREPDVTPTVDPTARAFDAREAAFGLLVEGDAGYWTHESGRSGPYGPVSVFPGPEHCDWERFLMMFFGSGAGQGAQFVRAEAEDPQSVRVSEFADVNATLPPEAEDAGYSLNGARLFVAGDLSAVWIVFQSHTERWPRQEPPLRCA